MKKKKTFGNKVRTLTMKILKWAKVSKLNLSVLVSGGIIFLMTIIISIIVICKGNVDNKVVVTTIPEETAEANNETTTMPKPEEDELFTTEINEDDMGNYVSTATKLDVKLTAESKWYLDGTYYMKYNLEITNVSNSTINGWTVVLRNDNSYEITDNWNAQYVVDTNKIIVMPYPDNEMIRAGESINVGFVCVSYQYIYFDKVTVFVGDSCETYNVYVSERPTSTYIEESTDDETTSEDSSSETTSEEESSSEDETTDEIETDESSEQEDTTTDPEETTTSGESEEPMDPTIPTETDETTETTETTVNGETN